MTNLINWTELNALFFKKFIFVKNNLLMNLFGIKLLPVLLLLVFSGCNVKENKEHENINSAVEIKLKYAKGFEILDYKTYKKLTIKAPYPNSDEKFEFIITKNKISKDLNTIQTPVKSVVVTSTTHIPMLELLQESDKLKGFPNTNYISSPNTRKLIEEGKILELGHEENMNTELLLNLHPDLVIGFTLNSNNKMFNTISKLGIPVILNGDWLEETPLGRAEWIKFFGLLFEKEALADSIFNTIEKNYLAAKKLASEATEKPSVISGGLFKDIWNLPAGESFEAAFLQDANTDYLWKDSKGKGSLSLNIENVFLKGKDADIWISPSYFTSLEQLKNSNEIYTKFKAFKQKKVYSFVNKKGKTGGVIYFETAPSRPDLVLKDLIKIAHPQLLKNYSFTFYEALE